jgi:hypothetical protein
MTGSDIFPVAIHESLPAPGMPFTHKTGSLLCASSFQILNSGFRGNHPHVSQCRFWDSLSSSSYCSSSAHFSHAIDSRRQLSRLHTSCSSKFCLVLSLIMRASTISIVIASLINSSECWARFLSIGWKRISKQFLKESKKICQA